MSTYYEPGPVPGAEWMVVTSEDTPFRELSVRSRTLISKQALALHVVRAVKDKVQGAGMRGEGWGQIAGAANPGSGLAGLGVGGVDVPTENQIPLKSNPQNMRN